MRRGDAYESLGGSSMLGVFLALAHWRDWRRMASRVFLRSPIVAGVEISWVWVRVS